MSRIKGTDQKSITINAHLERAASAIAEMVLYFFSRIVHRA